MAYLAAVDSGGRTASYRPTTQGSHVKTRIKEGHDELVVSLHKDPGVVVQTRAREEEAP